MFKFLKPNGRGCKTHSRLKGAVSIEYVVLLVCIALASLVAFGVAGKSIGGIVNNTKDMLIEKVDNATSDANGESGSGLTYEVIDGDKDGKHYHNDTLFTGTCSTTGKDYVDGVEQVATLAAGLYDADMNLLASLTRAQVETDNSYPDYPSVSDSNFQNAVHVVIPAGTTKIGQGAFYGCTNLVSVELPETVTSIEADAFSSCSNLTSIDLTSVSFIGEGAFSNCSSLESVYLSNDLFTVSKFAFSNCTNLTTISFGGTVDRWNTIAKLKNWNQGVPATQVTCSDGTVTL